MQPARDPLTELRRNDGGMTGNVCEQALSYRAIDIRAQDRFGFALRHERCDQLGGGPALALHHMADQEPVAIVVAGRGWIEIGITALQTPYQTIDIGSVTEADVVRQALV